MKQSSESSETLSSAYVSGDNRLMREKPLESDEITSEKEKTQRQDLLSGQDLGEAASRT